MNSRLAPIATTFALLGSIPACSESGLNPHERPPVATTDNFRGDTTQTVIIDGSPVTSESYEAYIIQPGDTLGQLAAINCTTVERILADNPGITDPDDIFAGDKLSLTDMCTTDTAQAESELTRDEKIGLFISTYKPAIEKVALENGLNVDVVLAQAILESGYGTSELAVNAYNLFGMKAKDDWTGLTYTKITREDYSKEEIGPIDDEIQTEPHPTDPTRIIVLLPAEFMAFGTIEEGILEYAKTIQSRFPAAVNAPTAEAYIEGLLNGTYGRYATDVNYKSKLLSLISDIRAVEQTTTLPPPETLPPLDTTQPNVNNRQDQITTIESLNLTPEGYENFVAKIVDYTDVANNYPAYNMSIANASPNRIIGPQPSIEFVTLHYTVAEYDGPDNFLESTNNSEAPDDTCCGAQFFVDGDGTVYQMGDFDERTRANPPFDASTIHIEVEAANQQEISAAQNEATAYLTAYILKTTGLADRDGLLAEEIYGHAETRDLDSATMGEWCDILVDAGYSEDNLSSCNPGKGVRTDWLQIYAEPMRNEVYELLSLL